MLDRASLFFRCASVLILSWAIAITACSTQDTEGLVAIGEAIRDDDDDGWFTNETNQRVTLRWVGGTRTHHAALTVIVDGLRLPLGNDFNGQVQSVPGSPPLFNVDEIAGTRAIGTWLLEAPDQRVEFASEVRLRLNGPDGDLEVVKTLGWRNREESLSLSFEGSGSGEEYVLNFETTVEKFADPTPDPGMDRDSDRDNIFDREEASLAAQGHNIGDPEKRDIFLVVTHTHPDWALTRNSREWLITRFRGFQINLYPLVDPDEFPVHGKPGRLRVGGSPTARNSQIRLIDLEGDPTFNWREDHLHGNAFGYGHFLVLAESVTNNLTTQDTYGFASNNNLVVRSHLNLSAVNLESVVIGPEFHRYQAGVTMHELGHNIGLCHPTSTANSCPTLPQNEMNPAVTIMGTPAEDQPNMAAVIANAFQRPFNYSPTQWQSLDLTERNR